MFNRLLNLKYFLIISLYLFIAIGAAAATTLNEETKCTVVINELMSAKQRLIADEDGDYNDWVELYNCTDKNLELTNWYLSDRLNNLKKWQFPKIHIPAKGFLTLWVSGKDKVEQNGNSEIAIHTNFKIKRTGEPIILSNTRGEIIDQSPHIALSAHEVAGRLPDGGSEFFILKEPSPNAKNESAIAPIHIESPTFSHQSGFYDEPFELSLMHPNEQAVIYYTLDGSEPDPENLNGQTYQYKNHYQLPTASNEVINTNEQLLQNTYITYPYTKPIQLSDRNYEPDRIARIATTIEEEPNYFPKPEPSKHWMNRTIHTFNNGLAQINRGIGNLNRLLNRIGSKIKQWHTEEPQRPGQKQFIPEVKELPYWEYTGKNLLKGTPVRAIAVTEVNGRKVTSPIATATYFIGDFSDINLPIIAITAPEPALFGYEEGILVAGKDYDQWLDTGTANPDIGTPSFPANWKRKERARGQFQIINKLQGTSPNFDAEIRSHGNAARTFKTKSLRLYPKETINYPIFSQQPHTDTARINLRIDRDTRLHDDIAHNLLHGLAFATQRSEPYLVFINGEYFAILAAKDRRDTTFLQHQYQLPSHELTLLSFEYANDVDKQGPIKSAKSGDFTAWEALLERLEITPNISIEEINQYIDLESFIDYHAAEIYLVNTDWPSNNNSFWRYTGENSEHIPTTDGKWRWVLYDLDRAFRRPNTNMLTYIYSDEPSKDKDHSHANKIFKLLLENEDIKEWFITRFADLMNTTFAPERVIGFIQSMKAKMQNEMPRHIARWGDPISMGYWETHLNNMIDFAQKRPKAQRNHLKDFYNLGEPYRLEISTETKDTNGLDLGKENSALIQLNTLTLGVTDNELKPPVAASTKATHMEEFLALPWTGTYFAQMPVQLSVQPKAGYHFSHWEGDLITNEIKHQKQITLVPTKDTKIRAVLMLGDE